MRIIRARRRGRVNARIRLELITGGRKLTKDVVDWIGAEFEWTKRNSDEKREN